MNYMQFDILCIGRLKDKAFEQRCQEYMKWIAPYARVRLTELPDAGKDKENAAILRHLEKVEGTIIILSEDGKSFTSRGLAAKLDSYAGGQITFVIGGPEGLNAEVKRKGHLLWALSQLTFTHELARLLLCEQLFRAVNILRGGHYHND